MTEIDGLEEFSTYTVRVTAVYRFGGSNPQVLKESGEMNVQTLAAGMLYQSQSNPAHD